MISQTQFDKTMSGRGKAAAGAKAKAASGSTGKKGKGTSRSSKAGLHEEQTKLFVRVTPSFHSIQTPS
jgi:hypothetical protein